MRKCVFRIAKMAKVSAFTLAEIMVVLAIIAIIVLATMKISQSKLSFGTKIFYYSAFSDLQQFSNELIGQGCNSTDTTVCDSASVKSLPLKLHNTTTNILKDGGLCDRVADMVNVVGTADCTTTVADNTTDFSTATPAFKLSNGTIWYWSPAKTTTTTTTTTTNTTVYDCPEGSYFLKEYGVPYLYNNEYHQSFVDFRCVENNATGYSCPNGDCYQGAVNACAAKGKMIINPYLHWFTSCPASLPGCGQAQRIPEGYGMGGSPMAWNLFSSKSPYLWQSDTPPDGTTCALCYANGFTGGEGPPVRSNYHYLYWASDITDGRDGIMPFYFKMTSSSGMHGTFVVVRPYSSQPDAAAAYLTAVRTSTAPKLFCMESANLVGYPKSTTTTTTKTVTNGYTIYVDVNGSKGKSKLNEDVFKFMVYPNGTVLPAADSIGANNRSFFNTSAKLGSGTYIVNHVSYKEAACKSGKIDTTQITDYCGSYTVASGCSTGADNECKLIVHKPGY